MRGTGRAEGRCAVLAGVVRGGLPEEVAFVQRRKDQGGSHAESSRGREETVLSMLEGPAEAKVPREVNQGESGTEEVPGVTGWGQGAGGHGEGPGSYRTRQDSQVPLVLVYRVGAGEREEVAERVCLSGSLERQTPRGD